MLACTMLLADRVVLPYSVVMYNIACWQGCATIQCWVCTSVTCWQGCAAIQCRCVTRCPTSAAAPVVPWPCQPNNWKVTLPCLNTHTHTHTHTHISDQHVQVELKTGVFSDQQCAGGTEDGCFVSGFQWLPGDPNTCTLCGSYLYSTNTALRFWPHTVMKRRGLGGQSKGVRLAVCVQCTVYVYCGYT